VLKKPSWTQRGLCQISIPDYPDEGRAVCTQGSPQVKGTVAQQLKEKDV
jgi:hypothetical protein